MQEQYHTEGLIEREEITAQVKDLQRLLHAFLRKAKDGEELREVVLVSKEIRALIELLGKLLGRFPREPEISILINPTWISLKKEIFLALEPFPDAKTAVFAAIAGGDLSDVQKKMVAREPQFKDVTPGVQAIIDSMFEKEPEEPKLDYRDPHFDEKLKKKKVEKPKGPGKLLPTRR